MLSTSEIIDFLNSIVTNKELETRETTLGTVIELNNNGTCNCLVPDFTNPLVECRISDGISVTPGQSVIIGFPKADKNIPYVLTRSDLTIATEEEVSIRDIPEELGGLYLNHYGSDELQVFSVEDLSKSTGFNFTVTSDHELQMITKDSAGSFYLKGYDSGSGDFSVKYNADFTTREEL